MIVGGEMELIASVGDSNYKKWNVCADNCQNSIMH